MYKSQWPTYIIEETVRANPALFEINVMIEDCISKDPACIVGSECKSFNVLFEKTVYRRIPFVYLRRLYCKPLRCSKST